MIDAVPTFAAPLTKYLEVIRQDYRKFMGDCATMNVGKDEIRQQMIAEFEANLYYEVGRKFIKVIKGGAGTSVHSFIVTEDNGKFKKGDILKAASWRAPAKNFARGNLLEGTFDRVRWTGVV